MMDYMVGILLIAGGALACAAALGIARLPDIYLRMHASTKAGTLGAGLIMVAVALYSPDTGIALRALLTSLFLLLTAPVSAHIVGRAAHDRVQPFFKVVRHAEEVGHPNITAYQR